MAFKVNFNKINKNWIVLGVALIIGGIAAFAAQSYLSEKIRQIEATKESRSKITVVVAKHNLERGTQLSAENVATRAIPKEWAPSGAITPDQFSKAQGAELAHPVVGGEAIVWAHLEVKRAPNFSATIVPGRRAVTLPIDEISSISGMLQPGDLIDLIVSVTVQNQETPTTFVLLQGVTVLATGTYNVPGMDVKEDGARKASRSYNTVTLDVTPDDAKRVVAARNIGRITAFLRAPGDLEPISVKKKDAIAILGLRDPRPPVPRRPRNVQIIYGGAAPVTADPLNPPVPRPPRVTSDRDEMGQVSTRNLGINPANPSSQPFPSTSPRQSQQAASTQQAQQQATQQATQQSVQQTRQASGQRAPVQPPATPPAAAPNNTPRTPAVTPNPSAGAAPERSPNMNLVD